MKKNITLKLCVDIANKITRNKKADAEVIEITFLG